MTGLLPRRDAPAPGRAAAAARPWDEEQIARLAEDAARLTPAVSGPVATVRVDGPAARVNLDLVVDHGAHLPTIGEAVRRLIAARIESHTGLTVEAVTVTVVDLALPAEELAPPAAGDVLPAGGVLAPSSGRPVVRRPAAPVSPGRPAGVREAT